MEPVITPVEKYSTKTYKDVISINVPSAPTIEYLMKGLKFLTRLLTPKIDFNFFTRL